MRKAASTNSSDSNPSFEAPRHRPNWLGFVLCGLIGVLVLVAMAFYAPSQNYLDQTAARSEVVNGKLQHVALQPADKNPVGEVGVVITVFSFKFLGGAAWLIPAFLLWMTVTYVRNSRHLTGTRLIAMFFAFLAGAPLLQMQGLAFMNRQVYPSGPGGWTGKALYDGFFEATFGDFGSFFLLGAIYATSMVFIFTRDIGAEFEKLVHTFQEWRKKRAALAAALAEERRKQKEEHAKQKAAAAAAAAAAASAPPPPTRPGPTPQALAQSPKKLVVPKSDDPLAEAPKPGARAAQDDEPVVVPPAKPAKVATTATDEKKLAVAAAGKIELNIVKPEETKKAKIVLPQTDDKNYEFPPLTLLKEQVKGDAANSVEEHRQNAENLLRILGEFGVEVSLGEIHVGPVITRYEVVPAAGVRVEKISGLDKNIALGMRAQSVRILAPIPGKAAVGVEVPNQKPTPVGMREILESEDWAHAKAELPIALGKDVSGKPLVSDLTKMPHLLIAGATGSGKSVCINSIVASILYSKSPKDVRLIMVDPKVVELKVFNSLPHMLIPVVTEPKKVPAALKWLLGEMEQRYQIFAKVNVRNISGFNNRKKDKPAEPPPEQQGELAGVAPDDIEIPERLPYIVAIVDELADLMMIAPAEIETSIARLAQLARAAGIHLIIATQRPSVNVITGVIKANLPSRIAFQVASQVDSRTILDGKGAETLIGRGDMLFTPPGTSRIVRAQGAFVADEEVGEIVEFLKKNGPPQYAQAVQQQIDRAAREDDEDGDGGESDGDLGDDEDLFRQAFEVLKSSRRASTSMMQRRLRIGYNRAARIMDVMEDKGIVGPENGSSPREILVDLDTYQP